MPKTKLGKWSVGLIVIFFLLYLVFMLLVASGQRGGEKYFDNLYLAIPFTLTGLAAIASFFTALISIIKSRERSVLVFLSGLLGLLILLFILGELFFPH